MPIVKEYILIKNFHSKKKEDKQEIIAFVFAHLLFGETYTYLEFLHH